MNIWIILLAVIVQFVIGFVWYTVFFGKIWGKMHGFDKLDQKQQKEMQAKMGPWYAVQLLLTLSTTVVLAVLLDRNYDYSTYTLVALLWVGFTLPAQASAAIFGGAPEGYIWHKIIISSACSFISYLATAAILQMIN